MTRLKLGSEAGDTLCFNSFFGCFEMCRCTDFKLHFHLMHYILTSFA